MTDSNPVSIPPNLIDRAKAIILTPRAEWPRIDAEPATIAGIFTGYAMILAAIPPVAGLIGGQIFGLGAFGITYHPSLAGAVGAAVAHYVFSLVGLFLLAMIIDFLAPTFGGHRDKVKAFKLAAYSATAGWLVGIFALIPALSMLGVAGLYSLYLLYLGLLILMKAPPEKAMGYTVVSLIAGALLFIVAGGLAAPFGGMMGGYGARDEISGEMTVPGVGKVDLGKLDDASKQMEAAAKKMEEAAKTGGTVAVSPAVLQAMLSSKIGRFTRTEIGS